MILIALGVTAIIAVVFIVVRMTRREPQRPGRHSRGGGRARWAYDGYVAGDEPGYTVSDEGYGDLGYGPDGDQDGDETATFFAAIERPEEIACEPEPVPGAAHEEFLPAPPPAAGPAIDGAPVPPPEYGHACQEGGILLPAVGLAAAVTMRLTALIREAGRNEAQAALELEQARADPQRVKAEIAELERLRDQAEFPWLSPGQYGDNTGSFEAFVDAGEMAA